jgi:AraC-like DNA-binding protein/mannose-6-phosphate isomerase-like protein (cupin superfamily)
MKCRPITVDDSLQELTQHGTGDFPVSMDRQVVSDEHHGGIRHWHEEIQIALVTEGEVVFRAEEQEIRLCAGQGFFVNSGVHHEAHPTQRGDGVYICVNFLPNVIFGQADSVVRRDYVDPVLYCDSLRSFPLLEQPWHQEICGLLRELGKVEDAAEYGYEIRMTILLRQIWHLIVVNNRENIEQKSNVSFSDRQRMRALKTYIHKHYMEQITLADIAAAGHISRGECCRVFKRVEKRSPVQYLTRFRLEQSLKLLGSTELSVQEIARQVGFGTGSYFTEKFREEMQCTPTEYRRKSRGI